MKVNKPRFFYGYVIVAAGFLSMWVVHGTVNSFGVFFNPLIAEFGSTRAALSFANSLAFLTMGLVAILMGTLSDRFGPRLIMSACGMLTGAGYLLLSQAGTLWQLYIIFIVLGIGFSASEVVPLATVVRWFSKKRGMMSGIMKVGTGVGIMTMPLISSALIRAFKWRNSYLIIGIATMLLVIPLAQLMRRDPGEMGLLPDDEKQPDIKSPLPLETGLSIRQAIQTRQLWMVCGFYFTVFYVGSTILVHIVPHAIDLGIQPEIAAGVISVVGASSIAGRLVMGFTGDKIGHKRGMIVCFLIMIAALSWLQAANNLWTLFLFGAVYGFNHGGFFALISPLVAGLFGTRSQGSLLGMIFFSGTIGGSISAVLSGHLFDITGSYCLAFLILLVLAIIGLILLLFIKPVKLSSGGD